MSRLKFVLDVQACQCVSRYRGIGRYSLAFAQTFVDVARHHDVSIMLNGMFPEATADLSRQFESILPPDRILTWQGTGPTGECDPVNRERRERAERSREMFLASHAPDFVHVSSLFEGFPDNAVTSVGESTVAGADSRDHLRLDSARPSRTLPRSRSQHANLAVLLSEARVCTPREPDSRDIGGDEAGVDRMARAQPLDCGEHFDSCGSHVSAVCGREIDESSLRARIGVRRPFVMYTGGPDRRKNIDGLIKAWALLPPALRASHQLAVVCRLSDGHAASLRTLASECGLAPDEMVLPGFVSDEDLVGLYNLATVFVFPSWHEGFGLPVLEAMKCGAAVIAANTSSLPEVVGRADALFDPMRPASMAAALERTLTDESFRASLQAHGIERASLFSWRATAQRALDAFEAVGRRRVPTPEPECSARS